MTNEELKNMLMKLDNIQSEIEEMKLAIQNSLDLSFMEACATKNEASQTEIKIEERTSDLLLRLGLKCSLLGFKYIIESVKYISEREDGKKLYITKTLYPHVAKKCFSTPSRVERSIRHAIEYIHLYGDMNLFAEIFPYYRMDKANISNTEFLTRITDYLMKK